MHERYDLKAVGIEPKSCTEGQKYLDDLDELASMSSGTHLKDSKSQLKVQIRFGRRRKNERWQDIQKMPRWIRRHCGSGGTVAGKRNETANVDHGLLVVSCVHEPQGV